jgi:hypothetical protein
VSQSSASRCLQRRARGLPGPSDPGGRPVLTDQTGQRAHGRDEASVPERDLTTECPQEDLLMVLMR